jgi:hypothetical protein
MTQRQTQNNTFVFSVAQHNQVIDKIAMVVYNIDSESQYSASSFGDNEDADSASFTESGDDEGNTMGDSMHNGNRSAAAINEIEALARNDTQMLRAWRIAVLLIIAGTFAVVTAGTCVFIKKQQDNNVKESVSNGGCEW